MFYKGDCEGCSETPTIFLTQIVNGELRAYNLCRDCPHMDMVDDPAGCALAEMLLKLSEKSGGVAAGKPGKIADSTSGPGGEAGEPSPLEQAAEEFFEEDAEAGPGELATTATGPEPVRAMRAREREQDRRCRCGMTLPEFEKHYRLGCPACYETFREELQTVLRCSQTRGCRHQGKIPPALKAARSLDLDRGELERELDEAIRTEDFERAAHLRDLLRQLRP
jgi:protein-arginine kinase activator protein McsA